MEVEWAGSGVRGVPRRVCRDEVGRGHGRGALLSGVVLPIESTRWR